MADINEKEGAESKQFPLLEEILDAQGDTDDKSPESPAEADGHEGNAEDYAIEAQATDTDEPSEAPLNEYSTDDLTVASTEETVSADNDEDSNVSDTPENITADVSAAGASASDDAADTAETKPVTILIPQQAKAKSKDKSPKHLADDSVSSFLSKTLSMPIAIGIAIGCLVIGLVLGPRIFSGNLSALSGKYEISESELDHPVGILKYKGKTTVLTARDVIRENGTLSNEMQRSGKYDVPSAELVLSAARTAVIEQEAASRDITVTDEDIAKHAEKMLGTSDFTALASSYGMDEESVKALVRSACVSQMLQDSLGAGEAPTPVEAPPAPEEGQEGEMKKEYAEYIIKLAGDDWIAEDKTWKEGSLYANLTEDAGFTADKASYAAAQTAYSIAFSEYSEKQDTYASNWRKFTDELFSEADVHLGSLLT